MAVKVVPMLAPRVNGYIRSKCKIPTPTNGVRADVKIDDDCTNMVNAAPRQIAT